jgi:hypothetical protein
VTKKEELEEFEGCFDSGYQDHFERLQIEDSLSLKAMVRNLSYKVDTCHHSPQSSK